MSRLSRSPEGCPPSRPCSTCCVMGDLIPINMKNRKKSPKVNKERKGLSTAGDQLALPPCDDGGTKGLKCEGARTKRTRKGRRMRYLLSHRTYT